MAGNVLLQLPTDPRTRKSHRCCGTSKGECASLSTGGDCDGVDVLTGAIMAVTKGEGQETGTAKGYFRTKGTSSKSTGTSGGGFDRHCYHCGANPMVTDRLSAGTWTWKCLQKQGQEKSNARARGQVCAVRGR